MSPSFKARVVLYQLSVYRIKYTGRQITTTWSLLESCLGQRPGSCTGHTMLGPLWVHRRRIALDEQTLRLWLPTLQKQVCESQGWGLGAREDLSLFLVDSYLPWKSQHRAAAWRATYCQALICSPESQPRTLSVARGQLWTPAATAGRTFDSRKQSAAEKGGRLAKDIQERSPGGVGRKNTCI